MYLNSDYGGPVTSDIAVMNLMIENLEPLLWKYRVNVGFYGHNHVVQRQTAVLNKTVVQRSERFVNEATGETTFVYRNPQAPVQMVVGTGGAAFTGIVLIIYIVMNINNTFHKYYRVYDCNIIIADSECCDSST